MIKTDQLMNSTLHLAFMFSCPLLDQKQVKKQKDGKLSLIWEVTEIDQIDHQKEWKKLQDVLKKKKVAIKIRRICGTYQNLQNILKLGSKVLHFSGHGDQEEDEKTLPNSQGQIVQPIDKKGDFLIFEKQDGMPYHLGTKELQNLLQQQKHKISMVFVASCYSEQTGWTFHNAGVNHVICIRKKEFVRDDTAIFFTEEFYYNLFGRQLSVCDSFYETIQQVKTHQNANIRDEHFKYLLIKANDKAYLPGNKEGQRLFYESVTKRLTDCNCQSIGIFKKGMYIEYDNNNPEKLTRFKYHKSDVPLIGRQEDVCKIIGHILDNKVRFVNVTGFPGIGKRSIVKKVAFHLNERNVFEDGIIYITFKHSVSKSLSTVLYDEIASKISSEEFSALRDLAQEKKKKEQILQNQENQNQIENSKEKEQEKDVETFDNKLEKVKFILKEKTVLIILDSVEEYQKENVDELRNYLEQILDECKEIKILITSKQPLQHIGDFDERLYRVGVLSNYYTVKLFFEHVKKNYKEIDRDQIQELINADENVKKKQGTHQLKDMTMHQIYGLLKDHILFKKLEGHPCVIRIMASLNRDQPLIQLLNDIKNQRVNNENLENNMLYAFVNTFETSIKYLQQNNAESVKLLQYLSLMPGGITPEDLIELYGESWKKQIKQLILSDLIRKKEYESNDSPTGQKLTIYCLLPFINFVKYIENIKDQELEVHKKITTFLLKKIRECYNNLDVESQRNNFAKYRSFLILYGENIMAAVNRYIDYKKEQVQFVDENKTQDDQRVGLMNLMPNHDFENINQDKVVEKIYSNLQNDEESKIQLWIKTQLSKQLQEIKKKGKNQNAQQTKHFIISQKNDQNKEQDPKKDEEFTSHSFSDNDDIEIIKNQKIQINQKKLIDSNTKNSGGKRQNEPLQLQVPSPIVSQFSQKSKIDSQNISEKQNSKRRISLNINSPKKEQLFQKRDSQDKQVITRNSQPILVTDVDLDEASRIRDLGSNSQNSAKHKSAQVSSDSCFKKVNENQDKKDENKGKSVRGFGITGHNYEDSRIIINKKALYEDYLSESQEIMSLGRNTTFQKQKNFIERNENDLKLNSGLQAKRCQTIYVPKNKKSQNQINKRIDLETQKNLETLEQGPINYKKSEIFEYSSFQDKIGSQKSKEENTHEEESQSQTKKQQYGMQLFIKDFQSFLHGGSDQDQQKEKDKQIELDLSKVGAQLKLNRKRSKTFDGQLQALKGNKQKDNQTFQIAVRVTQIDVEPQSQNIQQIIDPSQLHTPTTLKQASPTASCLLKVPESNPSESVTFSVRSQLKTNNGSDTKVDQQKKSTQSKNEKATEASQINSQTKLQGTKTDTKKTLDLRRGQTQRNVKKIANNQFQKVAKNSEQNVVKKSGKISTSSNIIRNVKNTEFKKPELVQQKQIDSSGFKGSSIMIPTGKEQNKNFLSIKIIDKEPSKKISSKQQQILNKTHKGDFAKDKKIDFEPEQQLYLFYASSLILDQQYDQAEDIFKIRFKLVQELQGDDSQIIAKAFKANCKKLLSLCFFKQNKNFDQISRLLLFAIKFFESARIQEGQAVCQFALASFYTQKTQQFVTKDFNPEMLMKEALWLAESSSYLFEKRKNKVGQAQSLKLQLTIQKYLNGDSQEQPNDNVSLSKPGIIPEIYETISSQIQQLEAKQMELTLRQKSNFNPRLQGEDIALIIPIQQISSNNSHFNPNSTLRKSEKFHGRKNLTQRKIITQVENNNQNQVSNFANMLDDQKVKECKIDEPTVKLVKDKKSTKSQFFGKNQNKSDTELKQTNEQEFLQKDKQEKNFQRQNEKQKAFRKSTKEYKSESSDNNEKYKEKKKKKLEDLFKENTQLILDGYQESGETSSENEQSDKKLTDKAFLLASDKKQNNERRNTVQIKKDQILILNNQNKIKNQNFDCFSQNTETVMPNQALKNFQQIPFDVSSFFSQDVPYRIPSLINNLNLNNLPEIKNSKLGQIDNQNLNHHATISQSSKQNTGRFQMFNQSSIMGISHEDDVKSFDNLSLQSQSDFFKNLLKSNKLQEFSTKGDYQKQNDINSDANNLTPQLQSSDSKSGNLQKQQSMHINNNNFSSSNDSVQTDIFKIQDQNNFSDARSVEDNTKTFLFNPLKTNQKDIDKISIIGDEIKQNISFEQSTILIKHGTISSGDIPNDSDEPIEVQILKYIDGPKIKIKKDDNLIPIPIPIPIKTAQSQPSISSNQSTGSSFFKDLPIHFQLEPNPSENSQKFEKTSENDEQKAQFGNQKKKRVIAEQLAHESYINQFYNDPIHQKIEASEERQNEKFFEEPYNENNYLFVTQQEIIYQQKINQLQGQIQEISTEHQNPLKIANDIYKDANNLTYQNIINEHQMQEYQQAVDNQQKDHDFGFYNLNGAFETFPSNQNNEEDFLTQLALQKQFTQSKYAFNPVQTLSSPHYLESENNYLNLQLNSNQQEDFFEKNESINEKVESEINQEVVGQIRVQGYNEHQISIDENNITEEQKSMITCLYDIFNQSDSPQQRALDHQNIIQYLNSQKIFYTIKQHKPKYDKQTTQNSRKSQYLSTNYKNTFNKQFQLLGDALGTVKDKVVGLGYFKQMNKGENSTDYSDDNFKKMKPINDKMTQFNETVQDNFDNNYYPQVKSQQQLQKHYNQQELMRNYHKQSHEMKSFIRYQMKQKKNEKKNISKIAEKLEPIEEQSENDNDNLMQDTIILTKSKRKRKSYKNEELEDLFLVEAQNIIDDTEVLRKEAKRQIHTIKNKTSRKSRKNLGQQSPKLASNIFSSGASLKSKKSAKHKKENDQNLSPEELRKGFDKRGLQIKENDQSQSSDDLGSDIDLSINSEEESDDSLGVQVSDYKAQGTKKEKKKRKKEAFLKRQPDIEEAPLSKRKRKDIEHKDTDEEIEKDKESKNSEDVAFDSQDSDTNNLSQSSNTAQPPQVFINKQNKQSELKLPSRFNDQKVADNKSIDNCQSKKQKDQPYVVVKQRQSVGNVSSRSSIHKSASNQLKQHQTFTGRNSVIEKDTKNNLIKKESLQIASAGSAKSKDSLVGMAFKKVSSIFFGTKTQSSSLSPNAPDQSTEQISQDKANLTRESGCNTSRTPARRVSIIEKKPKRTSRPLETSPQKKHQIIEDRDSQDEPLSGSRIQNKTSEEEKQSKVSGVSNRNVKKISENKLLVKQKIEIEIVKCDLTDESSDAIVCPADYLMKMDHGIASQVVAKGGQIILEEVQAELKKKKHFEIGKCLFTQGGNLKTRHVIHVVCSAWNKFPQQSDALKKVESCVKNSLNTARKLTDIQIISMPMISVGKGNDDFFAQRIIETCVEWSTQKNTGVLTKIRLCAINDQKYELFMNWIDMFQIKEIEQ